MIPLPFLPVVDGVLLPEHPLAAVANGAAVGIDLLIGTNRDELTLFGLGNPALMAFDEDGVTRWVGNAAPDMPATEVIDAYRTARRSRGDSIEANAIWVAVGTDIVFRWPSLQLAAAHVARGSRAFVYLFDWESPAFGGILGSCHALELPFVFGAVNEPAVQVFSGRGPAVEKLSSQMQRAWLAFAGAGDPGHDGIGVLAPMGAGRSRHDDLRSRDPARIGATRRGAGRPGALSPARVGRARLNATKPRARPAKDEPGAFVNDECYRWPKP